MLIKRAISTRLLADLRKATNCSILKGKEALTINNDDYVKALEWLQKDLAASSGKKADKLKDRVAEQGLVCVTGTEKHKVMVELNCETDFVAKSEPFQTLLDRISSSIFLLSDQLVEKNNVLSEISRESMLGLPLSPPRHEMDQSVVGKTIGDAIRETVGVLGENIQLRRSVAFRGLTCHNCSAFNYVGSYVHGGRKDMGRIAALVALDSPTKLDDTLITKQLAQHIVGMDPKDPLELMQQEFFFGDGLLVKDVLSKLNIKVNDFKRYSIGE